LGFVLDRLAPLFQHLAIPDEAGARVGGEFKVLRQLKTCRRASLLTERAEHAARGVEDKLVEYLLLAPLAGDHDLYVHRDHVNAIFRTGERAEVAGDAERLVRLRVHVQPRRAMKTRRDFGAHLRILLRVDALARHRILVSQRAEVELERQLEAANQINEKETFQFIFPRQLWNSYYRHTCYLCLPACKLDFASNPVYCGRFVETTNEHILTFTRRGRDRRLSLRRTDEPYLAALLLQIEVARAPVDRREHRGGDEEAGDAEGDHDHLALPSQVHAARERFDGLQTVPAIERLHGEDGERSQRDVQERRRQHPLPTQVHQLIVAVARERPTQPEVDVEQHHHLGDEDNETQQYEQAVIAGMIDPPQKRKVPAAKIERRGHRRDDDHRRVLGHEEERPTHAGVFRVETRNEFRFRFRQIE